MRCDLTTDHKTIAKQLIKKVFCVSCKQTHPYKARDRAPYIGLGCLLLTITPACSQPQVVTLCGSAPLCRSLAQNGEFYSETPKVFMLFENTAKSPKGLLEITSSRASWALLFQADLPLPPTQPLWRLRVTSQLGGSVWIDPARATPSLCLFNT